MLITKAIIVLALLIIIGCLGNALYYLLTRRGDPHKMAKALSFRIGLSLALFLFLILAFSMHWITPHGI